MEVAEDVNIRPADKHVPFYDEIEKYDNNLSSIASGVRFVKLDNEPIFRDFFVLDIQQCDSFLFLMDPKHLFMYDATGKFIRQIGQNGQGPGEYVLLNAPLQLDEKKRILYAADGYTSRFLSYDFDGNCLKTIRYANSDWSRAYLLDQYIGYPPFSAPQNPQAGLAKLRQENPEVFPVLSISGGKAQKYVGVWDG